MVVGSRLRLITLAASTLAAVAFAAAVAGRGCGAADDSPEGAVRAFMTAARAGDRRALRQLLGPRTRARLAAATDRATQLVGGEKRFEELDLIAIGEPGDDWSSADLDTVTRGDQTVVVVTAASGQKAELPVVEVDGHWRIELPGYLEDPP